MELGDGFEFIPEVPFSDGERERAIGFLAGKDWPEDVAKGSAHWLADELLTALRVQEPPWEGLAAALEEVAFLPETDPVIRDYVMQHLGHLWEQDGAREEIEVALWKAVESADETTPGTALIALSRGYRRGEQVEGLARVGEQALEIARNPSAPLASRVTALAIAGERGGRGTRELAEKLVKQPETPVILRKVAENVLAR